MLRKFLEKSKDLLLKIFILDSLIIIISISIIFTSCTLISEKVFHQKTPKGEKRLFKRYSLFIANSSYKFWDNTPIAPMNALAMAAFFEYIAYDYNFKDKIFYYCDVKKEKLINILNDFSKEGDENTQLLFYYSGHGFRDKKTNMSYIIPKDGKTIRLFSKDKGNDLNWISVQSVIDIISRSKASQKILIFDSCNMGAPEDYKFKLECVKKGSLNPGVAVLISTYGFQYATPELPDRYKNLYIGLSYLTRWFLQSVTSNEYRRFLDKNLPPYGTISVSGITPIKITPFPLSMWDKYMKIRHPSKSVVSNEYLFEDNVVDLFEIYEYIKDNWNIEPGTVDAQYPILFGKGTTFFPVVDTYRDYFKKKAKKDKSEEILSWVYNRIGFFDWNYIAPLSVDRLTQLCNYHCQYLSDESIKEKFLESEYIDDLLKIQVYYILANRGNNEAISRLKYIEMNSDKSVLRNAAHKALLSIFNNDMISGHNCPYWYAMYIPPFRLRYVVNYNFDNHK